ncbi:MAG: DMT family transporter [Bacteroidales bacterium]|jgi:drug/metabolite transporter (DMT)-like permease|nr:DMT family transporter [Bacteroidales bacterium]
MKQYFVRLHLSIFIAGFTGILGKLITLNEVFLVWYRMLITSIILLVVLSVKKQLQRLSAKELAKLAGTGILLTLHWIFFYGSIKASNVSIGVVCFSLSGVFTAIFEPLLHRRRLKIKELFFSALTLFGIALIFHFDSRYRLGITLGTISSALAALFIIANKHISTQHSSTTILFYEMVSGFLFVSVLIPFFLYFSSEIFVYPDVSNSVYILCLAVFCTIGLYTLQTQALRKISAFTVNLSYNLEPLYSIILAMIIFGEEKELNFAFYTGLGLIVLSVALQTWSFMRDRKTCKIAKP